MRFSPHVFTKNEYFWLFRKKSCMGHKNQDLGTKINFQLCEFNCWHSSKIVKISFSKLIVYVKNDPNFYDFFQLIIRNSLRSTLSYKNKSNFERTDNIWIQKKTLFSFKYIVLCWCLAKYLTFLDPDNLSYEK